MAIGSYVKAIVELKAKIECELNETTQMGKWVIRLCSRCTI